MFSRVSCSHYTVYGRDSQTERREIESSLNASHIPLGWHHEKLKPKQDKQTTKQKGQSRLCKSNAVLLSPTSALFPLPAHQGARSLLAAFQTLGFALLLTCTAVPLGKVSGKEFRGWVHCGCLCQWQRPLYHLPSGSVRGATNLLALTREKFLHSQENKCFLKMFLLAPRFWGPLRSRWSRILLLCGSSYNPEPSDTPSPGVASANAHGKVTHSEGTRWGLWAHSDQRGQPFLRPADCGHTSPVSPHYPIFKTETQLQNFLYKLLLVNSGNFFNF